MLKKFGITWVVVVLLVLGIVSFVSAQEPAPPTSETCPYAGTCPYGGMQGNGMHSQHGGMWGYGGTLPTQLAETLGMTVEDVYAALTEGKTVVQLAEEQGIALIDVVDALLAHRVELLNQAVENETMTREQADWMIAEMEEHMLQMLEWGMGVGSGIGRNSSCDSAASFWAGTVWVWVSVVA
ncbi:MAG: hypothetical protein JXA33_29185 [Anaerolineae bacterium]|nr:hypothetical protein [Anaerolineae bacterium]